MSSHAAITTSYDHELTVEAVRSLARDEPGAYVSLYMPTHRAGRDVTQDPIRFRRLVDAAAAELDDAGPTKMLHALARDADFWAHGTDGLAVLVSADHVNAIRLSRVTSELVVVSDRFHLKPLLCALGSNVTFDVLALSRGATRLVHSSPAGGAEVDVSGLPANLHDALRWDDREPTLTTHSAGRTGSTRVTAAFHGQGGAADSLDADTERFLRIVDRAIVRHRGLSKDPLVLAGVDELVARYRALTRCQHVVDGHVRGNPDGSAARDLVERAHPLTEPESVDRVRRARNAFLSGSAARVDTVEQAVIAAAAGQIASILVPSDLEQWGRFTPGRALLTEHDVREPWDHDLTDVAAIETLRHGGDAFAVPTSEIPGGGTVAASLHY